ncbi:MAG TPA: peptide ABC transporter substrate-binding protein, partial [Caulobacteraceae bacterium]
MMWRAWAIAAACVATLGLGGCEHKSHRPPCPPGALCLADGNGAEPTSLDPAHIDGVWEGNIISQMIVGLTDVGADGKPVPGVATAWQTSPDGLTWTFHLRNDAQWSDGSPVTADDFVFGVQRVLDPKTASNSAFILFPFMKNAEAVNAGKLPLSAAGIEAPDPHTVVIRLSHPWPLLPTYAAGRELWPEPRKAVERWGDNWTKPGRYLADGPYTLVAWRLGDAVVLKKNPRYWGADKVCFGEVDFTPSTDAVSNERSVKAGDLDVSTTVQSNRVTLLRRSALKDYVRTAPQFGVTYLSFNVREPQLKDVRVRQALSMAVDRDFITAKLLRAGQTPAYGLVPYGVPDYPAGAKAYWADWPLARRQAEARRLLAAAGYGPGHPLKLLIKHRNSADPTLFLPSVQNDWKQVGVQADLQENDVQVAYMEYELHDYQVGDAGWLAGDGLGYLDIFRSNTGANNFGQYANPQYDAELDAASSAVAPADRAAHMKRAEQILLADAPFAPLYFIASRNLVSPRITGWVNNPL